ncbi:response regulator transcription factor [Glaciecola sp. XM2]|uniref:response regulator n=1 Tax=Glaciecola sp. XM2 TaxID=1914931 RepID=UPI001BDE9869|nr:response regulator transcription factor [Glaciecola sp. XM2]MBT1452464.1 response regulator transcription factor [Glaciecola sp. XM2]
MIKVFLVDDQTLVREGIKSLLSLSDKVRVVGEAANGRDAVDAISASSNDVDVVLMDIRMPILDGIDALRELVSAEIQIPIIMLTTFDDHESVMRAIKAGAKGYLLKDVSLDTLVESIEAVNAGNTLIQPAITERLIEGLRGKTSDFDAADYPEALSKRETEILRLMAAGCSNKEMAQSLFRSEGTIKNQVSSILAKLGVRDRTRAVLKAIEQGLI